MADVIGRHKLLLVVLLLLASCGGGPPANPAPPANSRYADHQLQLLTCALPALPLAREASTVNTAEINGKFTAVRSVNAIDNGQALDLISGSNELSWGIWSFNLLQQELDSLQVVMTIPENDRAWVALSDFSRNSWEFHGPLPAGLSLPLDDSRHHAPDGSFHCAVITGSGDQATVHKLILTTDDGWVIVTIDDLGNTGGSPSLAIIDGKPAISYYSFYQNDLKFASSSTATGGNADDWSVMIVDSAGDVGNYSSLAEVEGQPAISYRDWSENALKYVRRLPVEPYSWTPVTVRTSDIGEMVGTDTCLAVVGGYPLITHHDSESGRLLHAVSVTPTGMLDADWQNYTTDNSENSVGKDNSLAIVDGKAAVAYVWDSTVSFLRYKWFSDPAKVSVAMASGEARSISLAVVDGRPAISWYDDGDGYMYYSFSSTLRGTSNEDWDTIPIDFIGGVPKYTSLAVVADRPAICYLKQTSPSTYHLAYAWSSTPNGWSSGDWRSAVIDNSSQYVGSFPSLVEVDSKPAVSYYDGSKESLKYAIRLGP